MKRRIRIGRTILSLTTIVALTISGVAADDWTEIFDGKTLDGWTQRNGTAKYTVVDGTIRGETTEGSPNSFLCSDKDYGDFELTFDVKVHNRLNSGVQIRSQTKDGPKGRVNGPQVEIEASGKKGAESGYIYGEAAGGWMTPKGKRTPHKHFKDGEWNSYRVLAMGANIKTWINGEPISDLTHEERYKSHPKGFIGLQVHSIGKGSGPFDVSWRKIRVREISSCADDAAKTASEGDWTVLFDGKNLDQWQETTGNWKIEDDGVLLIEPRPGEKGWSRYTSYLYTKKQYGDFSIELEYMYPKGGNSGLYFRIGDTKDATASGMEMQILDSYGKKKVGHHDNGGIIRTVGASKNLAKAPGEWNHAVLTAKGKHLTVEMNGEKVVDFDYSDVGAVANKPLKGYIGLQDHGHGNNLRFRNIRIKEL